MTEISREGDGSGQPPPGYDPAVVARIASAIQISDVVLTDLHFVRQDSGPLAAPPPDDLAPSEVGIAVDGWDVAGGVLGCSLSFRTFFDDDGADGDPYVVMGSYRLVYDVTRPPDDGFSDDELAAFVHWNAVFNAWPYWRELLTSVVNRAQLPRYVLPVLGLPRPAVTAE